MRRIILAIVVPLLGLMGLTVAPVLSITYEPNPPTALQVSPPYGYITFAGPSSADSSIDVRSATRWGTSVTSVTYTIDMTDSQPYQITQAQLKQEIINADDRWFSTLSSSSSLPDFATSATPGLKPSLFRNACGTGTGSANGISEVGFCTTSGAGAVIFSPSWSSGGLSTSVTEADMILDKNSQWGIPPVSGNIQDIRHVATHEFGHWHQLGDFYQVYGGGCGSESAEVMCDTSASTPQWGDKDAVRFLYPKTNSFSLSATGTITGSDSAVASIDSSSNSIKDMMFVWGDYSSTTGQTTIKAKGIWDLSSSTGTGTIGTTVTLTSSVSGQVTDVGAALYDVGGDSTKRDLIVSWSRPSGTSTITEYRVFWDITRSSNSFTFGTPTSVQTVSGSGGDRGTDVTVFDVNGDGTRDLLVMDTYSTTHYIWWYYGTLSTSGTVSTWHTGGGSGSYTTVNEDVGVSIPKSTSRVFTVDYKDSLGYMRQHLFHITTLGSIDVATTSKYGPIKSGSANGVGGGDATSIGQQSDPEQFFSWSGSTTGYYTVEWDSRINSHG